MGLGTLKTPINDEKLFDIQDISGSLAGKSNELNTGMERFLNNNLQGIANSLALKNLSSGKVTFDELLDGVGIDVNANGLIDGDEINKEVMQYAIDNKIVGQQALSETLTGIADVKGALKSLEFEITSQGYLALVRKLTVPAQRSALAKSFLLGYQENLISGKDAAVVREELKKSLSSSFSIGNTGADGFVEMSHINTVDDLIVSLKDTTCKIQNIELDKDGKITIINFDHGSGEEHGSGYIMSNERPTVYSGSTSTTTLPSDNNGGTVTNIDNSREPVIKPSGGGTSPIDPSKPSTDEKGRKTTEAQVVGYRPQNVWAIEQKDQDRWKRLEKKIDGKSKREAEKMILRWITNVGGLYSSDILEFLNPGSRDLNITARHDRIGKQKVDQATGRDREILESSLATPLRRLCLNESGDFLAVVIGDKLSRLSMPQVRDAIVVATNQGKININQGSDATKQNEKFRSEHELLKGFSDKAIWPILSDKKKAIKEMNKIALLYAQTKKGCYAGSYTENVINMIDNQLRKTNGDRLGEAGGKPDLTSLYKDNNDRGQVAVGDFSLLDKSDAINNKKALKNVNTMITMPGQGSPKPGDEKAAKTLLDSNISPDDLRAIFNGKAANTPELARLRDIDTESSVNYLSQDSIIKGISTLEGQAKTENPIASATVTLSTSGDDKSSSVVFSPKPGYKITPSACDVAALVGQGARGIIHLTKTANKTYTLRYEVLENPSPAVQNNKLSFCLEGMPSSPTATKYSSIPTEHKFTQNINLVQVMGEGKAYGANPVETFNIKAMADKGTASDAYMGPNHSDEFGPWMSNETMFVNLLGDYSLGYGVDMSDTASTSGLGLLALYRFATTQVMMTGADKSGKPFYDMGSDSVSKKQRKGLAQQKVLENLLWYLYDTSKIHDPYIADHIKHYIDGTSSDLSPGSLTIGERMINKKVGQDANGDAIVESGFVGGFASFHPGLVKWMQTTLSKSDPNELMGVMLHGKGGGQTLDQEIKKSEVLKLTPAKMAEIHKVVDQKLVTEYPKLQQKIAGLDPESQAYYKFADYTALADNISHGIATSMQANPASLGLGFSVALSEKVKGLTLDLSLAGSQSSDRKGTFVPGIGINYGGSLGGGVVGTTGVYATVLVPSLGWHGGLGTSRELKERSARIIKNLEKKGVRRMFVGLNTTVSTIGASVSLSVGGQDDKLEMIDRQYASIQSQSARDIKLLVNDTAIINSLSQLLQIAQESGYTAEQLKPYLGSLRLCSTEKFKKLYPTIEPKDHDKMVDRFIQIITQMVAGFDVVKSGANLSTDIKAYLATKIPTMADMISSQWKEEALAGLQGTDLTGLTLNLTLVHLWTANPLTPEGWTQDLLASAAATISNVFGVTNYDQGYTHTATAQSKMDQYHAIHSGYGNRKINITPNGITKDRAREMLHLLINDHAFDPSFPNSIHSTSVDDTSTVVGFRRSDKFPSDNGVDYGLDASGSPIIGKGECRLIPKSLFRNTHVNFQFGDSIKNKIGEVSISGQDYLVIPKTIDVALGAFAEHKDVKYFATIPAYDTGYTDIVTRGTEDRLGLGGFLTSDIRSLQRIVQESGDAEKDTKEISLDSDKVNTEIIKKLKEYGLPVVSNTHPVGYKPFENFPISASSVDKTNTTVTFDLSGTSSITCGDSGYNPSTKQLTVPANSSLEMKKTGADAYTLSVTLSSTNKLDIKFVDETTKVSDCLITGSVVDSKIASMTGDHPLASGTSVIETVPPTVPKTYTLSLKNKSDYVISGTIPPLTQPMKGIITLTQNAIGAREYALTYEAGTATGLSIVVANKVAGSGSDVVTSETKTSIDLSDKANTVLGVLARNKVEEIVSLDITKKLQTLDTQEYSEFKKFMSAVRQRNIPKTMSHLKTMIVKRYKTDASMSPIFEIIDGGDDDNKRALTDKMLKVFALDDASYNKKTFGAISAERNKGTDTYTRLASSAHTAAENKTLIPSFFPETKRASLRSEYNKKNFSELPSETHNDIFGKTAFYRRKKGDTDAHRAYMATTPGYINTIGSPVVIDHDEGIKLREWLFAEIDNDEYAKTSIVDAINYKTGVTSITRDQIKTNILNKTPIDLGDGKSIKEINTSSVVYLMRECANESIGMKINAITIENTTKGGSTITETTVCDGNLTKPIEDTKSSTFVESTVSAKVVGDMYINTTATYNKAQKYGSKSQFGVGGGLSTQKQQEAGSMNTHPGSGTDPNSGSNGGSSTGGNTSTGGSGGGRG